jgi:anaerobic magnesium-protoporphyrin IX monomethyl ester cyclase
VTGRRDETLKRVLLVNARRGYISSEYGLGYQVPLGLVFVAGPLLDAGFEVKLIDADAKRMSLDALADVTRDYKPDLIGISHTGSTAAHTHVVPAISALKNAAPEAKLVYGGVYPSFAFRAIMEDVPQVDYVVRGEGEKISLELAVALRDQGDLGDIDGLVWRDKDTFVVNAAARPLCDLDAYRPAWELVDWDEYRLLGQRASGIQFGRGCPNSCNFCGQWVFWKRYRRRSPKNFVDQIELLVNKYGIEHLWPADEHFAADRVALIEVLEEMISRGLRVSMSINTSVDTVLRDEDILHLYKKAGVDFAAIGVESDNDEVVDSFGKSSYEMACKAISLLRQHCILSCSNVIFGLEDETFKTIWRRFLRLRQLDPDFVNATYLTPHFWTPLGAKVPLDKVIEPDTSRWGDRNQVVATPNMTPRQLFFSVKATEFFMHIRPSRIRRAIFPHDRVVGRMGIVGLWRALIVWMVEVATDRPKKTLKSGEFLEHERSVRILFPRALKRHKSNRAPD